MSEPDSPEDADESEEHAYFDPDGECTCDHGADQHGWSGCNIPDCDCTACWEE